MIDLDKPFSIEHEGRTLCVTSCEVQRARVYFVQFPDRTPTLVLTQAAGQERLHFWTSIPEGRQREAEQYGPLISAKILAR